MSDIFVHMPPLPDDCIGKRRMVLKTHEGRFFTGSIDIGWRVIDRDGSASEVWWGNTKDADSLKSFLIDAHQHYGDFDVIDRRLS